MASVKSQFYLLFLLVQLISSGLTLKRRPLVFVLCLKGFRWDLPYLYSHLPHLQQLARTSSKPLWVESEFGGSQTNILSLMSGLHVEDHARRDFIETIPVLNEHVGGHTRLFHWPWFDRDRNHSAYEHLRAARKGQPEILELYHNQGRMSLQRLLKSITPMLNSLTNDDDRTNLILSFIDEPFVTFKRHGIQSEHGRRMMTSIDRLIGRLLSASMKNQINFIVLGDHGFESIECRQALPFHTILTPDQLNQYTERSSGTSFSFVVYPKTEYARQYLLILLKRLSNQQIQIYSDNQIDLPPKLRLPQNQGHPSPIIIFPRPKFYFAYKTDEHSRTYPSKTGQDCAHTGLADYSDDPRHLPMRTAFFAHGPLFKKGHINEPFLITDVYALLRQILCLSPLSSTRGGLFHIHNMLDLTAMSNTCAHLYLSSVNMIKSVSSKPVHRKTSHQKDLKLVYVNITAVKEPVVNRNLIRMRVRID